MRSFSVRCYFVLLLLIVADQLAAQKADNYRFRSLTTENYQVVKGLSQNSVKAILQDYKGYLWFGTWDGLNRYDGYDFISFYKEDGLSNASITALFEDNNGNIWIGTEGGLNQYLRDKGVFRSFDNALNDSLLLGDNQVHGICSDREGDIWVATSEGLLKYSMKNDSFTRFLNLKHDNTWFRSNYLNAIINDGKYLWLASQKGLIRFNTEDYSLQRYFNHSSSEGGNGPNILSLQKSFDGKIWLGTTDGLLSFNPQTMTFSSQHQDLPQRMRQRMNEANVEAQSEMVKVLVPVVGLGNFKQMKISALYEDSMKRLWVGTEANGLFLYDPVTGNIQEYSYETNNRSSLSNNRVQAIFEDRVGDVWVGTFNGVNQAENFTNPFKSIQHDDADTNTISDNYVIGVLGDDEGYLWMATGNGLNRMNRKTGDVFRFESKPGDPDALWDYNLKTLFLDRNGQLWLSGESYGLAVLDRETMNFKHYTHDPKNPNSVSSNTCYAIVQDSCGYVWISSPKGLNRYNPNTNSFKRYYNDPGRANSLSHNHVWNLYVDKEGDLYVATRKGVDRYDAHTDGFEHINLDSDVAGCIDHNEVFVVFQDYEGFYWAGLRGGGLKMFSPESGVRKCYSRETGLPNNLVYAIQEDDVGNLWISTNHGLSKFNRSQGNFINYDAKDGLLSNEFNLWSAWKDETGKMYFGGMNGLNYFDPDDVKNLYDNPPVVVTSFSVFDEVVSREPDNGDTITLDYTNNYFTIEFASLDFSYARKNKYKYRLQGVDKDFIVTDADNRKAVYRDLEPGDYTFELIGTNRYGYWTHDVLRLQIEILPPWWRTWLFQIVVFLSVVFVLWQLISFRIRMLRNKHKVEKRMLTYEMAIVEARQQALRLQMNPHFIFNSLNSIQSFILNNNIDTAISYLGKFSKLMRSNLSNSRESYVSVEDEVKSLRNYLEIEKLRFDDKFEYKITVDSEIDSEFVGIPPMLIQPFIENSIIHGLVNKQGRGRIMIDISKDGESLLWTIQDNGIGREEARQRIRSGGFKKKSRAMAIIQERLELLNKQEEGQYSLRIIDLYDENRQATGTRIVLRSALKEL